MYLQLDSHCIRRLVSVDGQRCLLVDVSATDPARVKFVVIDDLVE